MNPSPDRGKECLPPKKRESRQGSTEQRLPLDEFKPPAPLRSRPASTGRGEGARECHDGPLTNTNPHLLPSPPPLPAPVAPLPLPWHLAYPPSVPLPLLSVGERRATGSPSWRDEPIPSPLPHHSRWFTREVPLHLPPPTCSSSSSSPTFKSPFPADSREMWPYFNAGRRDYGTSHLFPPPPPPPHLFSHGPLYPADAGHRYLGKRPNGLDGPGSRTAPATRAAPAGEYGNDGGAGSGGGGRARPELSPRSSHANGRRRLPEGGPLYLDSPAPEGPDTHSSLQDRDPRAATRIPSSSSSSTSSSSSLLSTSPQPHGPDPRAGRGALLDPLGGSPAEAQIYYSLGSVYSTLQQSQHHHHHHSPQGPGQAFPLYSPSGSPLYGLAREPRAPGTRNSQHSPVGLRNSHDRTQQEPERERERERSKERDRERERSKEREREKEREQNRETERTSEKERQRDRDRELSPGPYVAPPARASPPAPRAPPLLPHFAKGSLIELAGGRLKRVEELRTEDFLRSASTSPEFHLSACTVMLIAPGSAHGFSHLQVLLTDRNTQELLTVLVEYPFFVRDRGWSSCCPHRTTQLYGLPCRQLSEGDVCLALTPTPAPAAAAPRPHPPRPAARAHRTQPRARVAPEPGGARHHHLKEEMPPPPPPPPLPHHHHHHPPPPAALGPSPPAPAPDPPAQEQPRPRKRRWSAPDTLTGTERTPSDLPQGSKQRKWQ